MKVLSGLTQHPQSARGVSLRVGLRRAVVGPSFSAPEVGRYPIESLSQLGAYPALEFRPKLRPGALLESSRFSFGPFVVELDALEHAALSLSDGSLTLGEVALAAAELLGNEAPDDPIEPLLALFSELARFDALVTGAQP